MIITDQVEIINNCLRKSYKSKIDLCSHDEEMRDSYSEDEKFLFEIKLDEFCSNGSNDIILRDEIKIFSPHDILYGILSMDKKFKNIFKILKYDNNGKIDIQNISHIVTANMDKGIWYFEKDLVPTNIRVTTFIELTLSDMRDVLRSIPNPNICLAPSSYNINNPKTFLEIVNENKFLQVFDFIPFVRKHTINSQIIKPHMVYRLSDKIRLIFVTNN